MSYLDGRDVPAVSAREPAATAADLLTWNEVKPNVRVVETTPEGWATQTYSVVADYGWAERILCEGCYLQDAQGIAAAITEVLAHG